MTGFLDLPVELLPLILQYIIRPSHIAALCLVNRYFHAFAIPQLYERAFIYAWHTDGKTKVRITQIMGTQSQYPDVFLGYTTVQYSYGTIASSKICASAR